MANKLIPAETFLKECRDEFKKNLAAEGIDPGTFFSEYKEALEEHFRRFPEERPLVQLSEAWTSGDY